MRPTECPQCEPEFLARQLWIDEILHLAVTEGKASAQARADELLEPYHTEHEVVIHA